MRTEGGREGRGHFVLRKAFNEAVNHVDVGGVGRGRGLRRSRSLVIESRGSAWQIEPPLWTKVENNGGGRH